MYKVGLDDSSIDKLLELQVGEIVAHHHLQDGEELAIRDEAILVDIVNLEGEA